MIQAFYGKLSGKEKKIFHWAAAVIALAMIDALFLRPVLSKLSRINEEITQKKEDIERDLRYLSYEDKILKERDAYSVYNTGESKTEEEVIAGFLKTVETIATDSGINLVKLNPAEMEAKTGFAYYFADLECDGRLENVIQFMHKIDSTQNLLKIVRFNLVAKNTGPMDVKASMKVSKLIIDPSAFQEYLPPGEKKSPEEKKAEEEEQAPPPESEEPKKYNSKEYHPPGYVPKKNIWERMLAPEKEGEE